MAAGSKTSTEAAAIPGASKGAVSNPVLQESEDLPPATGFHNPIVSSPHFLGFSYREVLVGFLADRHLSFNRGKND